MGTKMIRLNSRILLPAVLAVLGLFWLVYGLIQYGWWGENGPQSGFFPAIVGAVLCVVGTLAAVGGLKDESPKYFGASFHPLFGAVAVVAAALIIGFFPALGLFVFGWIKLYEKYSWSKSVITSLVTIAIFYGIFSLWLRVPFPEGIILDAIKG
jgi:uncharacterized ion transporter superfamily protein YfcC